MTVFAFYSWEKSGMDCNSMVCALSNTNGHRCRNDWGNPGWINTKFFFPWKISCFWEKKKGGHPVKPGSWALRPHNTRPSPDKNVRDSNIVMLLKLPCIMNFFTCSKIPDQSPKIFSKFPLIFFFFLYVQLPNGLTSRFFFALPGNTSTFILSRGVVTYQDNNHNFKTLSAKSIFIKW